MTASWSIARSAPGSVSVGTIITPLYDNRRHSARAFVRGHALSQNAGRICNFRFCDARPNHRTVSWGASATGGDLGDLRQAQVRERELSLTTGSLIEAFSTGADNLCFIPIRIRGSFIAGLGLLNKPTGFSTPDVKITRAIIDQASAHIEQVLLHQETLEQRKIQNDLDLARRVQLRLLPQQLPAVIGLDIAAHSRPARQIGGDFYIYLSATTAVHLHSWRCDAGLPCHQEFQT